MSRFSDEELIKFKSEFDNHVKEENDYRERNDMLMEEMLKEIKDLKSSTKDVVLLFEESRIGKTWLIRFGKFILWCAAVYGAAKMLIFK